MVILIPVSAGELLDRIAILEIKNGHVDVTRELRNLEAIADGHLQQWRRCEELKALRDMNLEIWELEDEIRSDLGEDFIPSARDIAKLNDQRAAIKRQASERFASLPERLPAVVGSEIKVYERKAK